MLTFWLSKKETSHAFVYYESETSWMHTILTNVDFKKEIVTILRGSELNDRKQISEFRTQAFSGCGDYVQIGTDGVNSELVKHIQKILYSHHDEDDFKLICLHVNSLGFHYTVVDATKFTVDQIVSLVDEKYKEHFGVGENKHQYYCGITNDLDIRMDAHRKNDFSIVDEKVYAWNCLSAKHAAMVEQQLGKLGFDIGDVARGGNGGSSDSTIVYLLKKGYIINH